MTNPYTASKSPHRIGDIALNLTSLEIWQANSATPALTSWNRMSSGYYGGSIITDLNMPISSGCYTALGTASNVPNSSYSWFIDHINSNTGNVSAYQRAVAYSTDLVLYERTKIGSVWGNWVNKSMKNESYNDGDIPMFNGTNGRFEKKNLAGIINSINPEDVLTYGVEWDSSISSPDGTRIGNPTLHRTLPVHNMMKGVLLADDGTEKLVLPDSSWIGQTRDGSMGQVMVKIPNYYFKCEQDGTKFRFKISTTKLAGYNTFFDESISHVYCSAYEAGLDRTSGKLASVVNATTQFRGGNNLADYDGTYRSLLGRPVSALNRTQFRAAARLRNTNNVCWNEYVYTIHVMMAWLAYVEYNTLNIQKAYNPALDSNGFKQGGLGMGVSGMNDWSGYNGTQPFIPCGISDSLGNGSGVVVYNVLGSDGSLVYAAPVPRYRGIENPFGHLHKWADGLNTTEDGTTRLAFATNNPTIFNDDNVNGFSNRGVMSHSEGWTKSMILGTYADLLPSAVGGSSSTYFSDYYWTNIATGLWGAILGGVAYNGANDGLGCVISGIRFSGTNTYIGSRLCFIPSV